MSKTATKGQEKKEPGKQLAPVEAQDLAGPPVSTPGPTASSPEAQAQPAPLLTRSTRLDLIAAALSAAQSEFPTVAKSSHVNFQKKAGGTVEFEYASLASIVRAVRPTLAKYKLAITQSPVRTQNAVHVTTMLLHASGQFLQTTLSLPAPTTDIKETGGAITYARRYAYAAMLGIVTDNDTDAPPVDEKKFTRLYRQLYTAGTKAGGTHKKVLDWLKKRYGIQESAKELTLKQLEEAVTILSKKAAEKNTRRGKKEDKGAAKPAAKGGGGGEES